MRFSRTIDDRLRETGGYTTGFDYLRLLLATSVFCESSMKSAPR